MILSSIIINRDLHFIEQLKRYEELLPFLQIHASFSDLSKAEEYLLQHPTDIVFSDIQFVVNKNSTLRKESLRNTEIILCLDEPCYEVSNHCLSALEYILKPVSFEKFTKALNSIYFKKSQLKRSFIQNTQPKNYFFVKNGSVIEKVKYKDILFFKGLKDYIWIQTHQKKIITLQTMKNLNQNLPSDQFIRIHKSYIVSLEHIDYIDRNSVLIKEERIPIGETYKSSFFENLKMLEVLWC